MILKCLSVKREEYLVDLLSIHSPWDGNCSDTTCKARSESQPPKRNSRDRMAISQPLEGEIPGSEGDNEDLSSILESELNSDDEISLRDLSDDDPGNGVAQYSWSNSTIMGIESEKGRKAENWGGIEREREIVEEEEEVG